MSSHAAVASTGRTIFIDGAAGTTGLGIADRLRSQPDLRLIGLPDADRKNASARQQAMHEADLVILCLPDDAAREAVALADALGSEAPRILDASTAHRVAEGWAYGFAELTPTQPARIASAARVSNPGCYATGAIALLHPLVAAGLLPAATPISIHAVSGYSGGGKSMIEAHEQQGGPAYELYALGLDHKHLPEVERHAGLARPPIFVPSVAHLRQGMLVQVPLHLDTIGVTAAALLACLAQHYQGTAVRVLEHPPTHLAPDTLNDTDAMELAIYAREERAVLVARLDNLGKGASGAAVQNARLMLGLPA